MRKVLFLLLMYLPLCVFGQQNESELVNYVIRSWSEYPESGEQAVESILAYRDGLAKYIKQQNGEAKMAFLENQGMALHQIAALCKQGKIKYLKPALVRKALSGMDLKDPMVARSPRIDFIVNDYYALKAILKGAPVDEAWGSMWFNTSILTLGNEYDYRRYRQVLELNNPDLALVYLKCLKGVFRFNGYTKGLDELRPYIEKYLPDGELKQEIFNLYIEYAHLKEGAEAPSFSLENYKGQEYSLSDYKGKVLVIDVWATWCGGCIGALPKYLTMREKYKDRKDIEFITISIDDERAFNSWKYALPRLKLMGMTNLLASKGKCDFQDKYNITGIPRYMLIDREGNIVTVFAPSPGKDFEKLIEKTLAK